MKPPPDTSSSEASAPSSSARTHRGQSKIAQLPKSLRDRINRMILDGCTYARIRRELPRECDDLNDMNLSRWKATGYEDWLRSQERLQFFQSRFEQVTDLLSKADPDRLPEIMLKLAAVRLCEFMADLDSTEIQQSAKADPRNLARFLNLLPRLSREDLNLRKYREAAAKLEQSAKLDLRLLPGESPRDMALRKSEEFFGFRPDKPIGPPLSEFLAKAAQKAATRDAPSEQATPKPE